MIIPIAEESESKQWPVVTLSLIALNVLAFIFELTANDALIKSLCYIPAHPTLLTSLTSMFLHIGFWHLFGNMLFLWLAGPNIEEAFSPFGMLILYLGAGIFGDFAHSRMIDPDLMNVPTLGASGAIAGLMGASIVIFPLSKVKFWYWIMWFWTGTFEVRAIWAVGFWFVQQLALNCLDPRGGIAYGAHIGGFSLCAVIALALVLFHVVEPHWQVPNPWRKRELELQELRSSRLLVPALPNGAYSHVEWEPARRATAYSDDF